MGERFLQVEAALRRDLLNLRAQKIVVPGKLRIVRGRRRDVLEPAFDRHQQPLRRADLEVMESDIDLDFERLKNDSR